MTNRNCRLYFPIELWLVSNNLNLNLQNTAGLVSEPLFGIDTLSADFSAYEEELAVYRTA